MSRGKRPPDQADATITFTYESAYNQIVEPGSYVSLSQYFIAHWLPAISPSGLKILLRLRAMGYYSPKTGTSRGDVDIEQKDLAALCGLGLSTLKRAFVEDEVLTRYVQRVFKTVRDPRSGRILKEHYIYVVKMDDALTDADKSRLEGMLAGPDKPGRETSEEIAVSPRGQNELSARSPIAQNEPSAGQNEPPVAQNGPPTGQNELSLKGILNTLTTFNTLHTPAARPGVLPSASPGEEQTGEEQTGEEGRGPDKQPSSPQRWEDLSEAERAPWLERAESELRENFGLTDWMKMKDRARGSVRGARAAILYAGETGKL